MVLRASILSILILVAAPSWASSDGPAAEPTGPRIEFVQQEVDLGGVKRGTEVVARFEFRNVGDAELRLLRVDPG